MLSSVFSQSTEASIKERNLGMYVFHTPRKKERKMSNFSFKVGKEKLKLFGISQFSIANTYHPLEL